MINGVRASSMRMLSTSSTMAKFNSPLHALVQIGDDQVVAEIIEAVLVVRAIGDVGAIGFMPGAGAEVLEPLVGGIIGRIVEERGIVLNDADREPERMVELAHPLRIAFGQVVVDSDEVNAFSFKRIQIERQRGDQGFPFAGLHFGDAAFMQDHAADQLHVEMPHVQLAAGHFAADGEGLRQDVVQGLPGVKPLS